jgi:hypothetical protein
MKSLFLGVLFVCFGASVGHASGHEQMRPCSPLVAGQSVDRFFRAVTRGDAGAARRQWDAGDGPGYGMYVDAVERATATRPPAPLPVTTWFRVTRSGEWSAELRRRIGWHEQIHLLAVLSGGPVGADGLMSMAVYYTRAARDIPLQDEGDLGVAKGTFDCGTRRIWYLASTSSPSVLPITIELAGRMACAGRKNVHELPDGAATCPMRSTR